MLNLEVGAAAAGGVDGVVVGAYVESGISKAVNFAGFSLIPKTHAEKITLGRTKYFVFLEIFFFLHFSVDFLQLFC